MEYRRLGESGTVVSRLALGSMYFGGETSETDAFGIMDAYVEAGGNLIDTANVSMGGQSEAIVGKWFAARPSEMTDRVVLATKGRHSTHEGPNAAGLSRRGLQRLLDESREFGLEIPITLQQQYSLLSRENEWEVIPAA